MAYGMEVYNSSGQTIVELSDVQSIALILDTVTITTDSNGDGTATETFTGMTTTNEDEYDVFILTSGSGSGQLNTLTRGTNQFTINIIGAANTSYDIKYIGFRL